MTIDELLAESCEYWELPEQIEDPEVLAIVAAVLRRGGDAAAA